MVPLNKQSMQLAQVVWFKRDLRISDHQPLYQASLAGPVIAFYVIEDEYWQLNDTSNRQWLFIKDCLVELSHTLESQGGQLLVFRGAVLDVLDLLHQTIGQFTLYSHEETGNLWTYQRDIAVSNWCKQRNLSWLQYQQFAVFRGKKFCRKPKTVKSANINGANLNGAHAHSIASKNKPQQMSGPPQSWQQRWEKFVSAAPWPKPSLQMNGLQYAAQIQQFFAEHQANCAVELLSPLQLPEFVSEDPMPLVQGQVGGRTAGVRLCQSFLKDRGKQYQATISSPLTAEWGCSRLSPHLAYGTISIRELLRQVQKAQQQHRQQLSLGNKWQRSLRAFYSRLVWHCYFIQKLESNPQAQVQNMHQLYNQLDRPFDTEKLRCWQQGQTGWPLVDACMRYLTVNGWINFRMRAMLVSVACYSLKLPWQPVAEWLAKLFIDYEPGIHYPQVQMQSGTNGNQVLRIYNPLSQAQNLDPQGEFIRKWVQELAEVPTTWIFAPEQMPEELRRRYGCEHYPKPLVDFTWVHREAKAEITALRLSAQGAQAANSKLALPSSMSKVTKDSRQAQLNLFTD